MNTRRYRILYIEKPASVGGSVISLYELVRGLDRDRYEPVVLFHGPNPYRGRFQALGVKVIVLSDKTPSAPPDGPQWDIAASLGQYSRRWSEGYRAAKQFYLLLRRDVPLARRVARIIREEAVDLVHHNNTLSGNRATVMAARMAGVSQVCHVRMLHRLSFVERPLVRWVDAFVYISRAVEQLYQSQGVPAEKGQVIHNPIDVERFEQADDTADLRAELGLNGGDQLISNVGRLDWWKGHDDFLQAMAEVVRFHPNARALIVGTPGSTATSQAYYRRLQRLVADLGLSQHVIFTGFRNDVPRIIAASDVVVHSASEPEPFGRVVVEAMAAGRPVVATAAGGVLDIVEDRVTGLLVPPKSPSTMADAIRHLLQNRERGQQMGQRAQRQAKSRFSAQQHVTTMQQIYERVLALKDKGLRAAVPSKLPPKSFLERGER